MSYPWEWHQDKTEQLRKHHAAGLSFSVMAGLLKTTRAAIAGKCARMRLTRPELDYAAAGRIGGKLSAEKRRQARPPKAKKISKFNFARKERVVAGPKRAKAAVVSVTPPEAPPPLNIPLIDLEQHHCRYITGDDRLYCGHPQVGKTSWCAYHLRIVSGRNAQP